MLGVMPLDVRKRVGRNIRTFRKERKWSQKVLADLAGITRTNLSHIELGKVHVKIGKLENIAKALSMKDGVVKLEDLVKGG